MTSPDKKYEILFNEYLNRMKEEKLCDLGKCSMSVKLSDMLFAYVIIRNPSKSIVESNIKAVGMISKCFDRESELHRQIYLNAKNAKAVIHAFPESSCTVGEAGVNIPPLLDDMAQIIGPDAKCREDKDESIIKVLKKRKACIIKGNGVLTYGRSLDEAYVACLVLDKAAKCFIDTTVIGRYRKISLLEAKLMHFVYNRKYSRLNQEMKSKDIATDVSSEKTQYNYTEKEMELRQQIIDAGVRLVKSNLVQGTWGNISARLNDKNILITPTGLDYLTLKPEDLVVINLETLEATGLYKPSGEKDIHIRLLKERPDINVVMHSHPQECSSLAAARIDLPVMSAEMEKFVRGDAKATYYALPSTKNLSKAVHIAMKGRNACLMANHGLLTVGATMEDALETSRIMEESCKAFIDKLAAKNSTARGFAKKRKDIFKRAFHNN